MDDRNARMARTLLAVLLTTLAVPSRADWPSDPSHFVKLTPGGRHTLIQSACPDGIGGAFVCWGTGLMVTMHVQRLDEMGRPTFPGGAIEIAAADGMPIEMASDGRGGAVLLLRRYVAPTTVEVQLRHLSSLGNVYWTTTLGTTPVPPYFYYTHVAFDPKGPGWIVAWIDASDTTERVRSQYVDWYGHTRWATTPTLERTAGETLALGPVEPDGQGGAWASCWYAYSGGTTVNVQHIGPSGIAEWGPTGVAVPMPLNGWIQQLAGDSQGNLWLSMRAQEWGDPSDRIQRLRPDGSASFGVNGLQLPHPERQHRRQAALGIVGPDHVFVAWMDDPPGSGWATELQAVDSSGTWLGTTRQLRTGGFAEYLGIRVYPLADGGAIVNCAPGGGATLPVQRVAADGAPLWPASTSLMNVPNSMLSYEAASENFIPPFPTGDGGIVSFRTLVDSVVTAEEPYPNYVRAQHLDANGQHGVATTFAAPPRAFSRSALSAPVPSPMTSSARVRFALENGADIELTLHDVSGRCVRTLARGRRGPGEHSLVLTRDEPGSTSLRAGLYWLRLTVAGHTETRELVVLN